MKIQQFKSHLFKLEKANIVELGAILYKKRGAVYKSECSAVLFSTIAFLALNSTRNLQSCT